jgi:hypothetical protein
MPAKWSGRSTASPARVVVTSSPNVNLWMDKFLAARIPDGIRAVFI